MRALDHIGSWGAKHAAAGVLRNGDLIATAGDEAHVFRWASVTKLVTAMAVLVAVEEGTIDLDEPAGPSGASVRHLLAHASGLPFEAGGVASAPVSRRVYSNPGFVVLGEVLEQRSGLSFVEYVRESVLAPAGMDATRLNDTEPHGVAAAGAYGPLTDLLRLALQLQRPTLIAEETLVEATAVIFPGLDGVLPGLGRQRPNDWGLGFEVRNGKSPHWTGSANSARTFGHFGGAGTFLWVDPDVGLSLTCLTDRQFGDWAVAAWPSFSDAVLREAGR